MFRKPTGLVVLELVHVNLLRHGVCVWNVRDGVEVGNEDAKCCEAESKMKWMRWYGNDG